MKTFLGTLIVAVTFSGTVLAADEKAIFAGGCFWCIESDFEKVQGVKEVVSGYTGGTTENPTYKNHTAARHREAVEIVYDASVVSYETLLKIFWRSVDPVDAGGQFCDRGHSYTTAVYAVDDKQKQLAQASKDNIDASGVLPQKLVTPIEDAVPFWPAENYHQDYHNKNPVRYKFYRYNCGRNQRVQNLWGDEAYTGIKLDES